MPIFLGFGAYQMKSMKLSASQISGDRITPCIPKSTHRYLQRRSSKSTPLYHSVVDTEISKPDESIASLLRKEDVKRDIGTAGSTRCFLTKDVVETYPAPTQGRVYLRCT